MSFSTRFSILRLAALTAAGLTLGLGMFSACAATGESDPIGGTGQGGGFDAGSGSGGLDTDAACAVASDEAKLVPVSMYILFDKSGSMLGPKWFNSTAALQGFFMDPESAGVSVGLRFFPDSGCDSSCNISACAQPLVEPAPLTNLSAPTDAQEQRLLDAFINVTPSGETPLSAALEGGVRWGGNFLSANPFDKAVVVLVTDGAPTECNTDSNYIITQAQTAFTTSGIVTFAVGLEGSNISLMDGIAQAGGSGQGIFIGANDVQQELTDALTAIRESAVACEYRLPDQVDGMDVDPTLVNVLFTPTGASQPTTVRQVSDESSCTDADGGWYYDDPANPSSIRLCPTTCAGINGDPDGELEILIGCMTIVA
jgi:hypothetical protein